MATKNRTKFQTDNLFVTLNKKKKNTKKKRQTDLFFIHDRRTSSSIKHIDKTPARNKKEMALVYKIITIIKKNIEKKNNFMQNLLKIIKDLL